MVGFAHGKQNATVPSIFSAPFQFRIMIGTFPHHRNPMKRLACLLISFVLCAHALAGTLSTRDAAALTAEMDGMLVTFEKGNAKQLIAKTHPSIYKYTGGKEAFEKSATLAVFEMMQHKVKFLESTTGVPTRTYTVGKEELCFVPRISVMQIDGRKARSTGYMVAIRQIGGKEWKFLDGAGFRLKPQFLYDLFPTLEKGITLPPNKVEIL
jgi:hypothetical protein